MILDTLCFFSAFKTNKCLRLISNALLYHVVCVQANHTGSWKTPFQRQFLIYERMTRLETAVPMVPLTAPPLPLNSGFKSSLAQTCPCVVFLFSSCWHLFTNVNHRATCLKFWEPYSTTYYNIRLELRQQLYSCHFNEKQDFLISKKNEHSQGRALHMSNAT